MADRLQITELDFDTIKTNLKSFLKQQAEFTDYDFDGAGLSVLLDILAYNTHYNAYYINMLANESFLDTALLRDSVVSHAKTLGYVPHSRKSATATINLTANSATANAGTLTIPKGHRFLSNQIDGVVYNFVVMEDTSVTKVGTQYYFENLEIHEGQLTSYRFVHDEQSNPKQIFTIPEANIDIQSLRVSVTSATDTSLDVYEYAQDITEVSPDSLIYYLQETRDGKYQIYFGNDILGKKLASDAIVLVSYLITSGTLANKANKFIVGSAIPAINETNGESISNFVIDVVDTANGGAERESVDEIKYSAPLQYASQNRIVSYRDYELYIRNAYPNLDSISVWGGEDEVPPVFGKVFVALKPIDGYYISESEKQNIIDTIIKPRSIVTVRTEFRDPEYLFLIVSTTVQYDQSKTTLNQESLKQSIKDAIFTYKDQYLDKFDAYFTISKLQEAIDSSNPTAIIGSDATIRVQKRLEPVLNRISNYTINFNVPLTQGTTFNKFSTTEFYLNDTQGVERKVTIEEIPKSFTGINSIQMVTPGSGYTSEPTVTISGDGFGATARAIVSLGKIQSIEVLNPGIDYNRATVTISGGGGSGATALALIDTKIGKLRAVYYTSNAERVVVNNNVGEIDYGNGIVKISDINVLRTDTADGLIRFNCEVETNIIQPTKNTILTIDESDFTSTIINLQTI